MHWKVVNGRFPQFNAQFNGGQALKFPARRIAYPIELGKVVNVRF